MFQQLNQLKIFAMFCWLVKVILSNFASRFQSWKPFHHYLIFDLETRCMLPREQVSSLQIQSGRRKQEDSMATIFMGIVLVRIEILTLLFNWGKIKILHSLCTGVGFQKSLKSSSVLLVPTAVNCKIAYFLEIHFFPSGGENLSNAKLTFCGINLWSIGDLLYHCWLNFNSLS